MNTAISNVVGRVGALAVSLGVGAAVFALPGLASADTEGSDGASGSAAKSESRDNAPRASARNRAGAERATGVKQRNNTDRPQLPTTGATPSAAAPAPAAATQSPRLAQPADTSPTLPSDTEDDTVTTTSAPATGNGGAAAIASFTALSPARERVTPAPVVTNIDARIQAQVRTVFHELLNWVSTLPINPVTTWLEGGLLMVRKSMFNQTASVSSIQTAHTSQLVTGKIDVIDPDGDGWNIEVVEGPSHGTVTLGTPSQKNGIGDVSYTYAPGEEYAGEDHFVVKVTPSASTFNILQPEALRVRYYTVAVGDAAEDAKQHYNAAGADPKDAADTHLYLSNAAAHITVKKQGFLNPKYAVTVTLPAETALKSFAWMDTRGNMGTVPVDTMLVEDWDKYSKKAAENGAKPLLTFKYSDQGGEKAVFVDVSGVTKNADGSYTISGDLKDGAPAQDGRIDMWDFTGNQYKAAFDKFINTAGLKNCTSVCTTVDAIGILGTTTLSASAHRTTGGRDYPLATVGNASALQIAPGAMGPGTTGNGAGNGTQILGSTGQQPLELTTMIPWGSDGSFIVATNLSQAQSGENGIFLYTAQTPRGGQPKWTKTQLVGNTWNAAVNVMTAYDQVLADANGNPVPTTYTGTPVTGANAVKLAVTGGIDPSSLIGQTITGDGIAPDTMITGYVTSDVTGVTYSVNNAITASTGSIAVTLPNKFTVQPGLVVGLSDGSVYYWNNNLCTGTACVGAIIDGAPVGNNATENKPVSLAIAPDGTIYSAGNYISIIDSTTNTITGTLPAAWGANSFPSIVVSPDGSFAYATQSISGSTAGVAVINTKSNTITATIELPTNATANAVVISPDGTYGYIANAAAIGDGVTPSLYQFDTATNALVTGAIVGLPSGDYNRTGLTFSSDGAYLYVSNAADGTISVVDTATNTLLADTIGVGGSPGAMALSPDGAHLFVTQTPNYNSNTITVIDTATNTVSNTIAVGNGPAGIAFNPNPGLPYAYVTNSDSSTVSVIDTQTMSVVGTFATGAGDDDTLGVVVTPDGLNVYVANWDGGGNSEGTVPEFRVATTVAQGWVQLQTSGGWGNNVAVNNVTELPNNLGFVVGLSNGTVATWNNPILGDGTIVSGPGVSAGCSNGSPGGCWNVLGNNSMSSINAIMPSGQTGGFVAIGTQNGIGWMQGFNGAPFDGGAPFDNSNPTTLLPYDGTTLVGSIGSAPVVATGGVISAPSYASLLPDLSASTAGCTSSYGGGSGAGCGGYVLTVQQAAGNPIRIGQTLYGGAGLAARTVITDQISDGDGNLCATQCNAGGTGVYLVDTAQLVAPGTPMSASDGTGFIVGFSDGVVSGWNNGLGQLVPEMWNSANNVMIPWRDGFVTGLDNGAVMYWSPSNTAGESLFVPDNGTSMALDYAGSAVLVADQPLQPAGWSQIQGWNYNCNCIGWNQAVTSMVQMGDGFAVGLTAPNDSSNGAVQLFSGFGAGSTNSAFGYQQTTSSGSTPTTSLQAMTPTNAWTEIASESALPGPSGAVGSIQALVPFNQLLQDSSGNWWNASSLVVGQTDNGVNSWAGSNLNPVPTGNAWNQLQTPAALPGQLDSTTLESAWNFATGTNAPSGTFGSNGAVGGSTDPIFSQSFNQAACGSNCNGDFETFTFNYPFGNDGVIYTLGSGALQADLNLSAAGYGYVFIPAGVWDKFEPHNYSAGLVLGVQGGPSVVLNPPGGGLYITETVTDGTSYTDTQETEVGSFSETIGIDVTLTGSIGLQQAPLSPLTLAYAYYTPGLMFTWNSAGNPDSLGMSYSGFSSTGYASADTLAQYFDPTGDATVTATVTPYASVAYGLFINSPISLDIFKLSVGYQNPITAELTVPIDDFDNTTLSLSSQGFLTASAAFIPGITSDLSWNGKYQLYSVTDAIQPNDL